MIKSMTGFAYNEDLSENYTITAEIKAYNSKTTDVVVRMPNAYRAVEDQIRTLLGKHFERGRIEVKLFIESQLENDNPFSVNWDKAQHFDAVLEEISRRFEAPVHDKLRLLLSHSGMLTMAEKEADTTKTWTLLEPLLLKTITDLIIMQTREGHAIADDLSQRVTFIEKLVKEIEPAAQNLLEIYAAKLKERIRALTKDEVELDPARIAQEAAILADKSDISEEITRALTHVAHFRDLMTGKEPAGRKLNFLLQELNREFNTMGSKIGNADVTYKIVAAKAEIEKLREQVQNIE